jgi:hypothetical protein
MVNYQKHIEEAEALEEKRPDEAIKKYLEALKMPFGIMEKIVFRQKISLLYDQLCDDLIDESIIIDIMHEIVNKN